MSYSKIDFINDLLASKKIDSVEKSKILQLTKMELKSFDSDNLEIKNRIKNIENKIKNLEGNSGIETKIDPIEILADENKLKKYLDPLDLKFFLTEYNQDPILKYTCHTIDDIGSFQNILDECKMEEYDFKKHLHHIHSVYNKLSYKYQGKLSPNITSLIGVYLGTYKGKSEWSQEKLEVKWISSELMNWSRENLGKVPNPLEEFQNEVFGFSSIDLNDGSTLTNFSELVIYFKNIFHIKSSNTLKEKLQEIIFLKFNDDDYNFSFDVDFSNDLEILTYSDSLMQGFVGIIEMSKKIYKKEVLNVKLYLNYDDQDLKEFKIVILNSSKFKKHFNSIFSQNLDNRGRYGDSFTNLINKQLNGLCDFFIRAEFEDKSSVGIVNVWDGKPLDFVPSDENIEGVEFILKMY